MDWAGYGHPQYHLSQLITAYVYIKNLQIFWGPRKIFCQFVLRFARLCLSHNLANNSVQVYWENSDLKVIKLCQTWSEIITNSFKFTDWRSSNKLYMVLFLHYKSTFGVCTLSSSIYYHDSRTDKRLSLTIQIY